MAFRVPNQGNIFRLVIKKRNAENDFKEVWRIDIDPNDYLVHQESAAYAGEVVAIENNGDPADKADLLMLEGMSNVYFLGQKGQNEVADYVAALDVGLLPYELNVETEHISPLKMYEYLALGLPVVSTAIPAALRHRDIVDVADNDAAFENLCQIALSDEDSGRIEERSSFAADNTWDHRVYELTEIISGMLHKDSKQ